MTAAVELADGRKKLTPDASPGSPGLRPGSVIARLSDRDVVIRTSR